MLRVNGASIITNLTHKTKIEFKGECQREQDQA